MGNNSSALPSNKKLYVTLDATTNPLDAAENYYIPKKLEDLDRMQNQHFIYHSLWKSNFSAPIEKVLQSGARVLDVGCGPGTWILEMATEYPASSFIGVDLVSVYPSQIMPRNAKFFQIDLLKGNLPFNPEFDYVRIGSLGECLSEAEWPFVIAEVIKILKPGGWLEIVENDQLPIDMGPLFKKMISIYFELLMARGVNPRVVLKFESMLAATESLSLICFDMRRITPGRLGGTRGAQLLEDMTTYSNLIIGPLMQARMNLTPDEYAEYWKRCVRELNCHATHFTNYRFWSRKRLQ